MADVLFVSKAVEPPWNDSGKNLVRDLARGLTRHRPTLMVGRTSGAPANARTARVYDTKVGFAPALLDQARVFGHLVTSRGYALWHFFFAPNPKSCLAGGLAKRMRGRASVHTISSAPRDAREIVPLLFADKNVVLSAHTERRLREAGLPADRLTRIAPAIEALDPPTEVRRAALRRELSLPETAPILVYPGDLEFGEGAHLMIEAARSLGDAFLVMACRCKTPRAREVERAAIARCTSLGLADRVRFAGETTRIHDLLACADVVALPSVDLYAKMDYPLVLLEAMSLSRAVVVAKTSAAEELATPDGALAVEASVDALAYALRGLIDDANERSRRGAHARTLVSTRYDLATMANAYEALYDTLLDS